MKAGRSNTMNRPDFLLTTAGATAGAAVCPSRSFAQYGIDLSAIRNRDGWRAQRDRILAGMQLVMGELPDTTGLAPGVVTLESKETPAFTRRKITYLSERGDDVPAYLLVPKTLKRRAPAMLCLRLRDCVDAATPVYGAVFRAKERLVAIYPDAGHEFSSSIRAAAYEFLDRWLK